MANGAINDNYGDPAVGAGDIEQFETLSESLLEILWRRRWAVLLTCLAALGLAVVYLLKATPLYTSTSRVYVEQTGPKIIDRDEQGVMTRSMNYLYTQAELLRSTGILSDALQRLSGSPLRTFADASNQMAALRRGLEVGVGKKDELISISLLSPYPDEAAHIVNTVVDAYVTFHDQRKRSTSAEVLRILREEKAKRTEELREKLTAMMKFRQDNEGLAFGTDQDGNIIIRKLERLSTALTEAQLSMVEAQSFYEVAQKMANDPAGLRQFVEAQRNRGGYAVTASETTALRTTLQTLQRDRADCLRRLKPDAPAITALNEEIMQVERQIAALDKEFAQSQLAVAQQQYLVARERQEQLQESFEQQREQAVTLNNQLAEYTILESDYEQTRKLCDLLDDRIKELDVSTEVGALNVTILEAAEPALEPSEPQKARVMALALGLGLFAGVGLALLRQWQDQRLRSTQEISALLALPVLGAVPSMSTPKETPAIRGQKVRISPDSHEAEAFRTVRTAIFFGAPKDEAKTILVTSPAPSEGKSTVVANLGIAIAQAGHQVIIVDADFRRPMQHRIFNLDRKARGLSSVLAGELLLADAIEHTSLATLDILTCGPDVSNPAEMLNSESFAQLVKELAEDYDRVLLDSPPVVAVTDAQILAARCDVTLLILRAEKSTRRISMQARESLAGVNARVLGVVVNDVPRRGGRYGYYSGYGYYYYDYHGYNGNGRKKGRKDRRQQEASPVMTAPARPEPAPAGETNADEIIRR